MASQLVRALRGKRSQPAVSRRLGYESNVVYAWESGRRAPHASDFFRLALMSRVEVAASLARFLGDERARAVDFASQAGVTFLLHALAGEQPRSALARAVGSDRSTIARWLDGKSEPRLPELLSFVAATSARLLEFVALFVDPLALPECSAAYRDLLEQRKLAYELPWSHALLRALELEEYRALPRHQPGFLAERLGISRSEEQRYLEALLAAKQIQKRHGRYVLRRVLTVDTRPNERDNRRLKGHWASVALARFTAGQTTQDTLFSYNLFAISRRDYQRIHALHLEYYERARAIVAASAQAERVVLLNLQLVPLSGS